MRCVSLTFANSQRRAPLIPQNVQTDAAIAVDVGVIDAGGEVDLWWLERVVGWEVNREEEDAAGVRRVAGSHDGRLPVELCTKTYQYLIVTDSSYRAVPRGDFRWRGLTRSSPIGPALHDEGGSLLPMSVFLWLPPVTASRFHTGPGL